MVYRDFATAQAARLRSLEKQAAHARMLERRVEILEVQNSTLRDQNERLREAMLRLELSDVEASDDSPLNHSSALSEHLATLEASGEWLEEIKLLDRLATQSKRRVVQQHCRVRVARILDALSLAAIQGNLNGGFSDSAIVREFARNVLMRIDQILVAGIVPKEQSGETALSKISSVYQRLKELENSGDWEQVTLALESIIRFTNRPDVRRECLFRIARIEEEVLGDLARARDAYKILLADNPLDQAAAEQLIEVQQQLDLESCDIEI